MRIVKEILGRRVGVGDSGQLILNRTDGLQEVFGLVATATVTSAQLLALNATPQTIVAAVTGRVIVPRRVIIAKAAGTAYAGIDGGEDLVLRYTDSSGQICLGPIESVGFLDQATFQTRIGHPPAEITLETTSTPVVLHMTTGEITTGNSDLRVRVWYDLIERAF
jgi:hypothetical protein